MVFSDAIRTAGARDDGSRREKRSVAALMGTLALRDRLDALDLGDDLRRRLPILEVGAAGEDARAIRSPLAMILDIRLLGRRVRSCRHLPDLAAIPPQLLAHMSLGSPRELRYVRVTLGHSRQQPLPLHA